MSFGAALGSVDAFSHSDGVWLPSGKGRESWECVHSGSFGELTPMKVHIDVMPHGSST